MVFRIKQLIGSHVQASDGAIGKIKDVYFDDHGWTIRYLVVETRAFFEGAQVLLSPLCVSHIDWNHHQVQLKLDMNRIKASPPIDTDKPVSRQHEEQYFDYYGYPYYWTDPSLWLKESYPVGLSGAAPVSHNLAGTHGSAPLDPRLRSANEVIGYGIHTTAEPIGHIEDFLIDSLTWAMRYIVVDTRHWFSGGHVVIPPNWIKAVDWDQRIVQAAVNPESVRNAPEFTSKTDFSPAFEAGLYKHYQRDPNWQ